MYKTIRIGNDKLNLFVNYNVRLFSIHCQQFLKCQLMSEIEAIAHKLSSMFNEIYCVNSPIHAYLQTMSQFLYQNITYLMLLIDCRQTFIRFLCFLVTSHRFQECSVSKKGVHQHWKLYGCSLLSMGC